MLLERDDEVLIDYCKNNDNLIRKIEDASNALKRYNHIISKNEAVFEKLSEEEVISIINNPKTIEK